MEIISFDNVEKSVIVANGESVWLVERRRYGKNGDVRGIALQSSGDLWVYYENDSKHSERGMWYRFLNDLLGGFGI